MMRAWVAAAVLAGVWAAPGPLLAQTGDAHDEVYDLATVEADHDLCGFPLTDEQIDVIAQRREALITRGDITDAEVSAVRDQISGALASQKAEGLCRQDGPEAKAYKRRLTTLGLL